MERSLHKGEQKSPDKRTNPHFNLLLPPKADTEVPNYDRTATRLGASAGLARFELLTMAAQPPKKPEGLYGFGYQQTENFCWLSGGQITVKKREKSKSSLHQLTVKAIRRKLN